MMKKRLWLRWVLAAVAAWLVFVPALSFAEGGALVLPASMTVIEEEAFFGAGEISAVVLPDNLQRIESRAFSGVSVSEVHLPSSIVFIADDAFDDTVSFTAEAGSYGYLWAAAKGRRVNGSIVTDFQFTDHGDGTCEVSGYRGSENDIMIPEMSELGWVVSGIGDSAFLDCSNLTSVTIPDSVTNIGASAFKKCSGLTSITIPDSVASIGSDAFYNCSSLNKIHIDSIESWLSISYQNYFSHPNSYKGDDIYACLLFIGNCEQTSITIPEGVTSIGDYAFRNIYSLTSITIPDSVTRIGDYAFELCIRLTSIAIPSSVTSISRSAFSDCSSLTSITLPEGVTSIGSDAFRNCSSLTSITIPEGVTSIGYAAFSDCRSLTSVTIPEGVTSIGGYAFYNCRGLTSITIPESVTRIGFDAFCNCRRLKEIHIDSIASWLSIDYFGIGGHPNYYALHCRLYIGNNEVTNIMIPEGVTRIGDCAFANCSNLTSITIPDSVTSIGYDAFSGCRSLTSITIPEGVTSIGDDAFLNCSSLMSITIPESMTNIGSSAFKNCSGLTSITIPEGVTSIGSSAFSDCSSLMSISLLDGVTSIGSNAFNNCPAVKYANIGSQGAKTLSANGYDFRVPGNPCNLRYIFNGSTVTDLQMTGISKDVTGVIIPDGVTWIGDGAFEDCTALTYVFIPDSVTRIGSSAFRNCRALTRFSIPGSVVNIGSNAFAGCANLTILCDSGSSAETYAVNQNIPYLIQHTQTYPPMPDELRDQIRDLMLNKMGNPITPDMVFCVLKTEEVQQNWDWFEYLFLMAEDVANFNFSDLDYAGNKADYLFLDAIKRCGTDKKTNYIDVARYAGNSFIMIEDVVESEGTVVELDLELMARNLVRGFKRLHPDWVEYITNRGFDEEFDSVMVDFFKGDMPASQLSAHMNRFGLGTPETFWQDADSLYQIKDTKLLLEGYKFGAFVCRSAMDLANRLTFMESLDLVKLRAIGKIYQQSSDVTVRRVGTDIVSFCNQDRAGRAVMLVSGWLSNTVMDLISDVIGDVIQGAIGAIGSTAVMLTNLAVNALSGADEIPEHIFEMEFAASAVRTSYQALQNAYQAYQQNPSDANFNTVFWAYVNYYEIIASAESSFVEMYELLLNTPVGNMLMGDDWRDVVQTARIAVASASLLASNITVQYSLWETGDYEAFQAGMQQAYAEYEQAMSGI